MSLNVNVFKQLRYATGSIRQSYGKSLIYRELVVYLEGLHGQVGRIMVMDFSGVSSSFFIQIVGCL